MVALLALFAVLLAAVQGNAVVENSRQGSANTYFLYSRSYDNARTSFPLPTNAQLEQFPSIVITHLDSNLHTVIIVHGHTGNKFSAVNKDIVNAFFDETARGDVNVNVIVVDWSTYTKQSYSLASGAVHSVGQALGRYLQLLEIQGRIRLDRLHLIGFNLGAHVVGFAGRTLQGLAARITGLDPSGSGWGSGTPRLSSSDARYVEVIHTDGDGIGANGIGTAIGDVDFFINGGSNQPGCLAINRLCSHNRAYELFAATLVRAEPIEGALCHSNLQLNWNKCSGPALPVGGDTLFKRAGSSNVYRANTGRTFPY